MRAYQAPAIALSFALGALSLGIDRVDASPSVTGLSQLDAPSQQSGIEKVQLKISRSKTVRSLQNRGYTDIQIKKRGISTVKAEACLDGERYSLRVGRSMKIRSKRKIGYCNDSAPRISRRELLDYLETSGYRRAEILSETRNHYVAQACEGRRLFSFKIDTKGAILDRTPIGTCQVGYSARDDRYTSGIPQKVYHELRRRGFSEITFFDKELPEYGAEACKNGKRFELIVNRNGRVVSRDRIGSCEDYGRPHRRSAEYEAENSLRTKGFSQIRIINKARNNVTADACKDRRLYRFTLDRQGEILSGEYVGRCNKSYQTTALKPKDVRRDLRARGFNRIEFVNRTPPLYRVKACLDDNRLRLKVNQRGVIVGRKVIGTCDNEEQTGVYVGNDIEDILRSRRYYDIELKEKRFYVAEVCRNARKFRLRIDQFGNEKRRKRIGWCRANTDSGEYSDRFAQRDWYSEDEVMSNARIAPSRCQDYMEWLLQNNSITFASGSARITQESRPLLNRLAHVANRCPTTNIEIAGHTDSDGSDYANQRLSERRASAVLEYLLDKNVDRERLSAVGYGETRPIVPNDTPWNKARNRRIEFVVDWADDYRTSQYDDRRN